MLLKYLMEEKQLDFNQPLLSVRRFSSTISTAEAENKRKTDTAVPRVPPLPIYKSELKSGPVRSPGNVPFVWEKSPGRPKGESNPQTHVLEWPPIAPKLPPGRILNVKQQVSDDVSKGTVASQLQTRNNLSSSQTVPSLDKNAAKEGSSKEGMYEKGSSSSDDDEAYVDALDTLSWSESFFLNCSISGVSGLDGPDLKPSGAFLIDPQSRDFMMGRFLPAAKAMASESPQYLTRKQPVAQVQPRNIKELVGMGKRRPLNQYRSNNIPHYPPDCRVEESENDNYDESDTSSFKVCGLFPRLCLQNSFCLLNPIPGMRKQAQVPISSVRRTKAKLSYGASFSETQNEHDKDAVYKQRPKDKLQTRGMHKDKNELNGESQLTWKCDYQKVDRSQLYKCLQGKGTLPYHDKFSQFAIHEEKRSLGIPEKSKNSEVNGPNAHVGSNFRELLANERIEWESGSASPVVEKTLFIESVHIIKSGNSNSSSSVVKSFTDYRRDDVGTLVKNAESASMDSSPQDIKHLNAVGEKAKVRPESLESLDSCFLSLSDKSTHDEQMDVMSGSRQDKDLMEASMTVASLKVDEDGKAGLESRPNITSGISKSSQGLIQEKVADDGKLYLKDQLCTDQETSNGCYSLLPLPPPLPKSPSESWLMRTLPTVSSRNSSLKSLPSMQVYPRVQVSKTHPVDLKWETMVKSSSVQHGHLQFSEELLTPIPEA